MPWFRIDDNLAFHHKVVAAGNPAIGLWARAGALCAQQLTDGFVPEHMIAALGTKAQADRLVKVGLWDRTDGGYAFHEWAERQPSKVDVQAERAAARERMREYRAKRKGTSQEASSQVSDERSPEQTENFGVRSPAVRETFGNPDPTHPIPTHPDPPKDYEPADAGSGAVAPRAKSAKVARVDDPNAQTLIAEWIDHCGARPPARVIGQVSKEVGAMLAENIPYADVRAGLADWHTKGLHPSALASVVHEYRTRGARGATRKESTTEARVRDGLALAERFSEMDAEDDLLALPQGETA